MPEPPSPAPASRASRIASPCIRRCCLDDNDICLGCFRSLGEIENWTMADDAGRLQILRNAAQRRHGARAAHLEP